VTDGEDLIELISRGRAGECVSPGDPETIAATLLDMFESGGRPLDRDENFIQRFSRRKITGELAELFNEIISRSK
jgi:glycosyltransferase involved in cell wall biosynthesis